MNVYDDDDDDENKRIIKILHVNRLYKEAF